MSSKLKPAKLACPPNSNIAKCGRVMKEVTSKVTDELDSSHVLKVGNSLKNLIVTIPGVVVAIAPRVVDSGAVVLAAGLRGGRLLMSALRSLRGAMMPLRLTPTLVRASLILLRLLAMAARNSPPACNEQWC